MWLETLVCSRDVAMAGRPLRGGDAGAGAGEDALRPLPSLPFAGSPFAVRRCAHPSPVSSMVMMIASEHPADRPLRRQAGPSDGKPRLL